ncbi:hypothetical protein KIPB_001060 [Kipferlia bialata]|uniref:Guanylate-binding protein N-terminal domain-containing protein n=1 Tax=Kipferlia bialata TaxID=797122 RepID=A0A9K3CPR7_9EUKA|nr:hypothetical protein KIPB_001060 [Kipferlia bialata]|eukprot:g1060.t1
MSRSAGILLAYICLCVVQYAVCDVMQALGHSTEGGFSLTPAPEFLSFLRDTLAGRPVQTVWVVGPNGQGKSQLINSMLQTMLGDSKAPLFPVSASIEPTTHGADVWDTPVCVYHSQIAQHYTIHPVGASECGEGAPAVLFIDTEGSESYETDSVFDQTMHTLAHLMADVIVYNTAWPYTFDITHLRELDTFTNMFLAAYPQFASTLPASVVWTVQKSDIGGQRYMENAEAAASASVATQESCAGNNATASVNDTPCILGIPCPLESRKAWLTLPSMSLTDMDPAYQTGIAQAVDRIGGMLQSRHHTPGAVGSGLSLANDLVSLLDTLSENPHCDEDISARISQSGVMNYTAALTSAAEAALSPLLPLHVSDMEERYLEVVGDTPLPGGVEQEQIEKVVSSVLARVASLNTDAGITRCRQVQDEVERYLADWNEEGVKRRFRSDEATRALDALRPLCLGVLSMETSQTIDRAIQRVEDARIDAVAGRYGVVLLGVALLAVATVRLRGKDGDSSEEGPQLEEEPYHEIVKENPSLVAETVEVGADGSDSEYQPDPVESETEEIDVSDTESEGGERESPSGQFQVHTRGDANKVIVNGSSTVGSTSDVVSEVSAGIETHIEST